MKWLLFVLALLPSIAQGAKACEKYRIQVMAATAQVFGPIAAPASTIAQLHVESSCRPDAKSWADAQGMAQFLPSTAAAYARIYPDLRPPKPYDPQWAILANARYIKEGIDHYRPGRTLCGAVIASWLTYVGSRRAFDAEVEQCRNAPDCDPTRFFGHVERFKARSDEAWVESRKYPLSILVRSLDYESAGWGKRWCSAP